MKNGRYENIPYEEIHNAKNNDVEAITKILNHYDQYIKKCCTKKMVSSNCKVYYQFDEDLAQKMRIRLLLSIQRFQIYQSQNAE